MDQYLLPLKVESLPGVGWSTRHRLEALGMATVADVRETSQAALQRELGAKNGALLWCAFSSACRVHQLGSASAHWH